MRLTVSPDYAEATQKYLYPPTNEQIFSFVEEVGVSAFAFERYYGIAQDTLKSVKSGWRKLPRKHWGIFYERTIPTYGSFNNFEKPESSPLLKKISTQKTKRKPTRLKPYPMTGCPQ